MSKKSLRKKLMVSYVIISFLLFAIGFIGYLFQNKISKNYDHIVNVNLPNAVTLGDMNLDVSHMVLDLLETSMNSGTAADAEALKSKILASIDSFEKLKAQYESNKFSVAGEAEVYEPVKTNWPKLKDLIVKNIDLVSLSSPEKKVEFTKIYKTDLAPLIHDFSENLNFVLDFQKAASSENVENALQASKQSEILLSISVTIGVLFSITFGIFFSKNLSSDLLSIAEDLKSIVGKVLGESSKMSDSSSSLLISVEAEASALQETSSSTEELSAMVKRNEENAEGSKSISEQSMASSIKGREAVVSMITAINEIDTSNKEILISVEKSNSNITEISNSIKQIGEKTKIINDIVFQTKLLSFNASVEAARAGEQGKGFAVVAEEVGNLAQMSGNAAKEISEMLSTSINKVEHIIEQSKKDVAELVNQSKIKVEHGIVAGQNCQNVLDEVVSNATKVNDLLSEISNASREQTIGISEISRAIAQLDSNTSSNTNTAKTTELSSRDLALEANNLSSVLEKLTSTVMGEN